MTGNVLAEAVAATRRKAPAKVVFFYAGTEDDEHPYEIEIGDEVEFQGDGQFGPAIHLGEITAIQARKQTARVSYLDETDWTKDGEPKRKTAFVALTELVLIRRVM